MLGEESDKAGSSMRKKTDDYLDDEEMEVSLHTLTTAFIP